MDTTAKIDIEVWPIVSEVFNGDNTKRATVTIDIERNWTVIDLILKLCFSRPSLKEYFQLTEDKESLICLQSVSIVLNGRILSSAEDFKTNVKESDKLSIVQGFTGG